MEKHLELTELKNALDYLEKAFYFLKDIEKDKIAWKWVILSIHSALYGFEISALKKKYCSDLLYEEGNKSRTKLKQKILAYRNSLQLTSSQKKSIEKIENFRKKIEHYDPTIWNIEQYILLQTVIDILDVIKLIALERWSEGNENRQQTSEVEKYFVRTKKCFACILRWS